MCPIPALGRRVFGGRLVRGGRAGMHTYSALPSRTLAHTPAHTSTYTHCAQLRAHIGARQVGGRGGVPLEGPLVLVCVPTIAVSTLRQRYAARTVGVDTQ